MQNRAVSLSANRALDSLRRVSRFAVTRFGMQEVPYLGFLVGAYGTRPLRSMIGFLTTMQSAHSDESTTQVVHAGATDDEEEDATAPRNDAGGAPSSRRPPDSERPSNPRDGNAPEPAF